ncbi:MAG: serine hydrolase [Candidatus Aminicenantales bacterium]
MPQRSSSTGRDGTAGAFIRNPERNIGVFLNVDRIERQGDRVRLIGRFFRNTEETTLAEGVYDQSSDRLSISIPNRGGTYDFARADDDPDSSFYARGKDPGAYRYLPPSNEPDGWPTARLEDVGISSEPVKDLIERVVYPAAESVDSPYIHGLLIARHGKLVLEEYFYGFHRQKPHDSRSASKSLTSILVGAAILDGAPLDASSPVYQTIFGADLPPDIYARKKRLTVEHLLTMSSGFHCDDRDPAAPGSEDVMQEQTGEPDWYRYTLRLPMIADPGTTPVYCSANANLLGAVLSAATGRTLEELFQALIAGPLQIRRCYLDLQPTGQPYMGGGIHWLPRDFMKLGQVLLNEGTWNGRRIISREWARRSIAPLVELRDKPYGYLWWLMDYPLRGKTVRAFFAGGNGGQLVMGIPELDLVVAFFAGNYGSPVMYRIQEDLVPRYILPAVDATE